MTTKLGELSKILIQTNTVVNTMFNDMLEKVRELEHAIGESTRDTRGFSSDLTRCLCDGVDDELRNIRALATTPHTAFLQTGASNLTATRVDALTGAGVDAPLFHETRVAELSGSTKETERTETGKARVAVVIMSVCERVESRCVTCLLTHRCVHTTPATATAETAGKMPQFFVFNANALLLVAETYDAPEPLAGITVEPPKSKDCSFSTRHINSLTALMQENVTL